MLSTLLISFQCNLYATPIEFHIKRSLSIWGFYLSSPFVFYSFLLADKPCFSIYSLISTLKSLLLHNIDQSFLPMYRDIYVYTFFSLFKNTKTFSNCSFTYFGPIQALSKSLLSFRIDTNYQSLNLTQNSYKRTDLAQLFSLDQIDHGTIFRWPCISNTF